MGTEVDDDDAGRGAGVARAEGVRVGGLKVGCNAFLPVAALITDVSPSSLPLFLRDVSAAALKSCSESGGGDAVSGPGGVGCGGALIEVLMI